MTYAKDYEDARRYFEIGDFRRALPLLERLAEIQYLDGLNLLGWMYMTGHGVPQNIDRAKNLLATSESRGSAEGTFYFGRANAMQGNTDVALRCYRYSAEKNYSPALFRVGLAYKIGKGVPIDLLKAERYFESAAMQKHRMAIRELALMQITVKPKFVRVCSGVWRLLTFAVLTLNDLFMGKYSTEHIT